MAISLDPYLFFQGDCKEAMEFYKDVFGGELEMSTMGESPGDFPGKNDHPDWIMHSSLKTGEFTIMGSDGAKASAKAAKIELSLSGDDEAKLKGYFDGLAEGGTVKMPLEKQFWGDTFGQLEDKYGVEWMVNIVGKKE